MLSTRRGFLLGGALGAAAGFFCRTDRTGGRTRLRPPGASQESDFLAACIRCGQCVQVCPAGTLELDTSGPARDLGTPTFTPREVPCNLCAGEEELLCIETCPTQALEPVEDLRELRMGIAVLDQALCLAYQGVICRSCWHACPYPNEAIVFDARLRPIVKPEHCIGCGLCDHACPTEISAIPVVPHAAARTEAGP